MGGSSRIVAIAACCAALAAPLTGCSQLDGAGEAGGGEVMLDGPLVVISEPPSADGGATEVAGPLALESGCMRVGGRLVVWPEGTEWDESATVLTFESGAEASIGDQISADALLFAPEELIEAWGGTDQVAGEVATQLQGCAGPGGEVAVFAAG